MDYVTVIIWGLSLALGAVAFFRKDRSYHNGLHLAWKQARAIAPKMVLAFLVSGFFSQIIPTELVAQWLGRDAGLKGVLIGSLIGGLTPGGPIICFPVVYILFKTGAAVPALISFLTAWSVFAFHRVLAYELPLMGMRFVRIRLLACLILPPLAGLMATAITSVFHIEL
ncbi:MAG: hypothetical protein Q8K46_03940 [Deltaproteobacteria bacterium]|nr:hypothetical protein [Deltaproteobacteria bacterium]